MVFITHDLSVLTAVCRAARGHVRRAHRGGGARATTVFARPQHPYTRALAAAFPTIGDPPSRMSPPAWRATRPIRASCPRAARSTRAARSRSTECASLDVELRAGRRRAARAACVHVGAAHAEARGRPREAAARRAATCTCSSRGARHGRPRGRRRRPLDARRARSSRWWASRAAARPRSPGTIIGLERPAPGERPVDGRAAALRPPGAARATAARCRWSSRTRPAR